MAELSMFHSLGWFVGQVVVISALAVFPLEWVIDKIKNAVSV